jgi:glycerol-3-phosphate dehydrogenase
VALAIAPRRPGARTYFMYPWRGRVLAGTYHAPWFGGAREVAPTADQVGDFLSDLSFAVPGWDLRRGDVLRTFAGLLPAEVEGTDRLAVREVLHDHGAAGGPAGLYSMSGVKFTTARAVAEKTLRIIFPQLSTDQNAHAGTERPIPFHIPDWPEFDRMRHEHPEAAAALVRRIVEEESVVHGEDLMLRRTDWGVDPRAPGGVERAVAGLLETDSPLPR